jgi:hypothetical protein
MGLSETLTHLKSMVGELFAKEYSDSVNQLIDTRLSQKALVTQPGHVGLLDSGKRLSYGMTREDGRFRLKLLVEDDSNPAFAEAREILETRPEALAIAVCGQAYSKQAKGEERQDFDPRADLVPGLSICHINGWPGTLGAIVEVSEEGRSWTGIVSAAHVLSRNNRALRGENEVVVYPDDERVMRHRIGLLHDYTYLAHYQDDDDPYNTKDVALVKLDGNRSHLGNLVPDPGNPAADKMPLTDVVPADQLWKHLGNPVFKVGRTTGFTEGILDVVNIVGQAIRISDRTFIYNEIAAARPAISSSQFSSPGDSGSVVYAADGSALGLIIGGSSEYTFIAPLETCLQAVEARLLPA